MISFPSTFETEQVTHGFETFFQLVVSALGRDTKQHFKTGELASFPVYLLAKPV